MPAPPVTTATWPASGFSTALPSFACSSDQYSISNNSASGSDSNVPTASASVTVCTQLSARSAATAASLALRPSPKSPSPGTRMTRGIGSSSRLMPPAAALLRAK